MSASLKHKTVRGVTWSFVDNIANQGITFLVGLVLARLLSPEEYGLIGIIMIFIAVFNSIVDSGFSNALIRKNDATNIDYNTVFITNLLLSVVLFLILFACAPSIGRFFNKLELVPLTRVMGCILIINAFAIIQRTLLVKRVDFKTQTKVSLIASVSSGVIGVCMAFAGLGVWSLVADEAVEYEYDKNGNLTKDLNKNISGIQYNILNLPSHISFADGSSIEYEYAADGSKVRTTHTINNNVTSTVYCGNAIYENGSLKMLLNEVGYYSFQDNKFHFYIKDHQGNIRIVADEAGKVDEVNDYYPLGGLMSNVCNNVQPYKYNGKELDRKGGLNWYDYGARHYDAMIGRWHVVDSMAEKYYGWSPYTYCLANPIKYVDIIGAFTSPYYTEDGQFLGVDENGFTGNIYITDEEVFEKYSKNGIANSKDIQKDMNTILMKDKLLTSAAESHIYTDILKKSTDAKLDVSQLYNGEVSIVEDVVKRKDEVVGVGYNNPEGHRNAPKYSQSYVDGKIRVTVAQGSNQHDLYTVESVQNYLGVHEYYGHGINNWSQKDTHWKCYNAQMNHPTFSKLPKDQQYEIKTRKYHYYINRNR